MKTLVVAFILIAGSKFSSQFGHLTDNIAECGDDANMNKMLRLTVRELHNSQRNLLAKETEENGSETTIGKLLNTSAMRPLEYDCRLEESAFNISEMCRNESMLDFAFIGSNHATLFLRGGKFDPTNDLDDYMATIKFMMEWWNTSKEYNPLGNLTSPLENSAMIPFLQMANTSTKEFGCAYSICNSSDFFNTSNSSAFVSFVCQYGEPHIKMSTSN